MNRCLLLALAAFSSVASAAPVDTCVTAASYLPHRPDVDDFPLPFDCEPAGGNACANTIVALPSSTVKRRQKRIVVWLAGVGGGPQAYEHLAHMAGYAGYRSLFLAWDNSISVGALCQGTSGYIGGTCSASECADILREELTTGRDDESSSLYTPNQLQGIEHRLAMVLNQGHEFDMADGSNNQHFEEFCSDHPVDGTRIVWDKVILGGHSFGGNQATYISYRDKVAGVIVADSGYDTCEATPFGTQADVYDPTSDYNQDEAYAVDWYGDYTDQSPGDRTFFIHQQDPFPGVNWPTMPPSFDWLTPNALDGNAEPLPGAHYDVEAASVAWNGQPIVSTDQEYSLLMPECTPHGSMATDLCMPIAATGGSTLTNPRQDDTSLLHLFDTYVEAMCHYR